MAPHSSIQSAVDLLFFVLVACAQHLCSMEYEAPQKAVLIMRICP